MLVPGYKIGLANIAGLFALYAYGTRDMVIVTVCRIFLAGLLTGTLFSVGFLLSISGAILALSAMALARKSGLFSIYGVSVAGALAHSVGQVLAVTAIYQQYFMQMFLPVFAGAVHCQRSADRAGHRTVADPHAACHWPVTAREELIHGRQILRPAPANGADSKMK